MKCRTCGQEIKEKIPRRKSYCYNPDCRIYRHYQGGTNGKCRRCGTKLRVFNNKLEKGVK